MSGVPWLPDGFTDVFDSTLVRIGEVELHTVQGGAGQPVLLVGGWPQNWYVWRLVMPCLAEHFRVIAVDPRGVGPSDKPHGGYDTGTVAAELVALMRALGHERFAMAGHDVGMWIGYALAADHRDVLERLALLNATIPGLAPDITLFGSEAHNDLLWHFAFNRKRSVNEQLVRGREHIYYGDQFRQKAARPTAPNTEAGSRSGTSPDWTPAPARPTHPPGAAGPGARGCTVEVGHGTGDGGRMRRGRRIRGAGGRAAAGCGRA
ncbi:alpha/beta fold hydrolase [Streptomyces sp. NEAU-L66]|uniref:alpha/beta fold hydrolase n=1 Tax=Streptomyces sp. NEAU-L66 TaxID=3390812 RepID=UPI0039C5AD2B